MKVRSVSAWHEDLGDCLFFHFHTFEEPPECICSTPGSSDFDEFGDGYWTHYVEDFNFNDLFDQAESINLDIELCNI